MDNLGNDAFKRGFCSALVNKDENLSTTAVSAQLLFNDPKNGFKVLNAFEEDLRNCDNFSISVAFITTSGIEPLLLTLEELEKKQIKGRILTTDYLFFSEPKALRKLNTYSNIEVRLFRCQAGEGFHTKGYIFENPDTIRLIVGSSNWTGAALATNHEWNAHLISKKKALFAETVLKEFNLLWSEKESIPLGDAIDQYEKQWNEARTLKGPIVPFSSTPILLPNPMQQEFVSRLLELQHAGEHRALLISATGTGKTYAAAFAVKKTTPKRVLFLAHREQILNQAKASFQRVLNNQYACYGIISGNRSDFDADCLFATMQTMAKESTQKRFEANRFDLIIIDEVHRAGANSYQRIMDYFKPTFWLGMTASPDRPDGVDIYALFKHNIAYEIRLQTALSEDLLCPFHYFGISDIKIDDKVFDAPNNFNLLTSDERVKHIIDRANYFGHSGDRVKGLIFCSQLKECEELSNKFNLKGFRTIALSGSDSQHQREEAIRRLSQDDPTNALDYIFTVDIFNEGVDIPEVNQVIFLRATESSIIFIQQLGRGLRKAPGKEFVVILDFIGNYQTNFLIPIALSGDQSYDKDNLRRFVAVQHKLLPGASSIRFDKITRDRIFKAIDAANTQSTKQLLDAYKVLKFKLGRRPTLNDFEAHNSVDVIKYFDKFGSYYSFLKRYDSDFKQRMSGQAEEILTFFCSKLGRAQRISEVLLLEDILAGKNSLMRRLNDSLSTLYHRQLCTAHQRNLIAVLTNEFNRNAGEKQKHKHCIFIESDGTGDFNPSESFLQILEQNPTLSLFLNDLVLFMKKRFNTIYKDSYRDTDFALCEKYTYEDVCRLLNWKTNMTAQNIGGYFYDRETKTLPVFINYAKDDKAIAYEDRFTSKERLIALSKSKRRPESADADHIYKRTAEDADNRIFLFVRRDKNDNGPKNFYFLGEVEAEGIPNAVKLKTGETAFEIDYRLQTPVRQDIFDYLTSEIQS